MLKINFLRISGPVDRDEICVAWIAGRLHPSDVAAVGTDRADPHRSVLSAGFRIGNFRQRRIQSGRVVEKQKIFYAGCVELPEGDRFTIRTPSPAIAKVEFFLV